MDDPLERRAWSSLVRRVVIATASVLLILILWSVAAPLSGAVIAPGVVKTELNRKTVQHQEGGIVRRILVREGQSVKAGEVLVEVGDVRTDATLDLQRQQRVAETIRQARLIAELNLATDFVPPVQVAQAPGAAEFIARERELFTARRKSLTEQLASFEAQSSETDLQIKALNAMIESIEVGASNAKEELEINRNLVEQGFIQRTRILSLERAVIDYESRSAEQKSERALARQRLAEMRSRVAQARNQYQQQAAAELNDTVARLRELDERLRPALDQAERQLVRSPVDGTVMALRVSAVGAVVAPREPIVDVVPAQERLVIEARVRPEDIDNVHQGAAGEVRLTAFEYRTMPVLPARVTSVSPDRFDDTRTGNAWFNVLLDVDATDLARFPEARLQVGMPAEAYVMTPSRSLFEYLVRPLTLFNQRGMREP
ncbi:MAG: HlyD family type I secretion periplasmic adaptor subunit [Burkholderiales bacterium]|nr:HlyD family type I secretion periplasmic adaptor subunit [Burkholderiales bacterium]